MRKSTLKSCTIDQLPDVQRRLHPAMKRHELIFAAGALNNRRLLEGLGSAEGSTFMDGMVAAGIIEKNPYWPDYAERADRFADIRSKKS